MAIDIKNYVDITTTFADTNPGVRSFGGLVFTAGAVLDSAVPLDPVTNNPIPYDEDGNAYSKDGTGKYVYYTKDSTTYYWTWDDTVKNYSCTIDGETYYPANYDSIARYEKLKSGNVVQLTRDEVALMFGKNSEEYKFANGYYSYISPSGRFASRLSFVVLQPGVSLVDAFIETDKQTNLFGSFTVLSVPQSGDSSSDDSTDNEMAELVALAKENARLDTKYLFVVARNEPKSLAITHSELFRSISGTCYIHGTSTASAYMPMAIFASTDFTNGQVVNFMFKQFTTEEPTVTGDSDYTAFNHACVNFYGRTQSNGQTLDFYQRGFNTDRQDTAVYCNEVWFKSACETQLVQLLTSNERIPASAFGVDLVKLEIMGVCSQAVVNGTFMQKSSIQADDMRAIREIIYNTGGDVSLINIIEADISSKGYSIYAYLGGPIEDNDRLGIGSEYVIAYYVFYGAADSIRFIKGNNILLK